MSKQFNITIDGVNFESDESGFLNLNDIHNSFGLPENKRPSRWRNTFRDSFLETSNLALKEIKHLGAGATKYYAGDEEAVVGYAMFVSVGFYRTVVSSFVALRNGQLLEAVKLADSTQKESKAFSAWMVMEDSTVQQTLKMLDIKRPNHFQKMIKRKHFKESLIDRGIIKERNYGSHGVALRMTSVGKQFLLDNREDINKKVELNYQAEKNSKF